MVPFCFFLFPEWSNTMMLKFAISILQIGSACFSGTMKIKSSLVIFPTKPRAVWSDAVVLSEILYQRIKSEY